MSQTPYQNHASTCWIIEPRDPVIFRDGRPFSSDPGAKARTLDFIPPSAVAGTCRTRLGSDADGRFDPALIPALLETALTGPLLCSDKEFFGPRPADALAVPFLPGQENAPRLVPLLPQNLEFEEGLDLPAGLAPLGPQEKTPGGKPPIGVPPWWRWETLTTWLWSVDSQPQNLMPLQIGVAGPLPEHRTHVGIDEERGTAVEGRLFGTVGLRFDAGLDQRYGIWVAIIPAGSIAARAAEKCDGLHPLGGEGRLAYWRRTTNRPSSIPSGVRVNVVEGRARLRLMLLTPAPFIDGWKPGWLTFSNSAEAFKGRHPAPAGSNMPELRLRAAAVPRFQTISGWGLAPDAKTGYDRPGPKPIRRLVPAGAVYFVDFPAAEADPASVARAFWLSSMADTEADRRDGFGLILAGTW